MGDGVEDDHTMKTEVAADAWSKTSEDGEEQCDLDEVRLLFRKIALSSLGPYLSGSKKKNNAG